MKNWLIGAASLLTLHALQAQKIGEFISVEPQEQTQQLIIPETHTFQILMQTGVLLPDLTIAQVFPDFTGFVPKSGSSTSGYLHVNHESVPGGVAMLEIDLNPESNLWEVNASANVNFLPLGTSGFNCSGAVTAWGTSITCEELYEMPIPQFPVPDLNFDGYMDLGWCTEIDPVTATVIDQDGDGRPDKLWKMGRMKHENAAPSADGTVIYEGVDDGDFGFLFKFIPTIPTRLGDGELYVLKMDTQDGDNFSATGQWLKVPNDTPEDCNNVQDVASEMGATNFRRIEDVEIGPNGDIYFAATSPGSIYQLTDEGARVSNFHVFAGKQEVDVEHVGGITTELFEKCDNLAFDCDGNLWVTEDGDKFHVWVVYANHTQADPNIKLFMITPSSLNDPTGTLAGSEPTGISFTPDCRFGFVSLQRCGTLNLTPQEDAGGSMALFNRDATLVFGRREALGTNATNGIAKNTEIQGNVFPLPAKEYMNVSFDYAPNQPLTFEMYNALGGRIAKKDFRTVNGENTIKVDTYLFPAGTYIISIKNGEKQVFSEQIQIN